MGRGAHRRHCNIKEVGNKAEQVLKSVLKLAADADDDDGKEVGSSDDAVESVEPDVAEADCNDEAGRHRARYEIYCLWSTKGIGIGIPDV